MKKILLIIIVILLAVIAAGMYKFDYTANKKGYAVDGNKISKLTENNVDLQKRIDNLTQNNKEITNRDDRDKEKKTQDQITVNVPLIFGQGNIGCGVGMKFVPYQVAQTTGVMNASYEKLFSLPYEPLNTYQNTLHRYNQLQYQSVSLLNGTAKVYLTGTMYGPGHCAEPEMRAQISQTALQFLTVHTVEVYLNGVIYDWCAMDESDGEGGCPENPRLWIDN